MTGLLHAVNDDKLRQVVQVVEASGQRRKLEPALAALRPRLRQLRPRRPLTLPRLLTVPFEAALARGSDRGKPYTIACDRLGDWHDLLLEGLAPELRKAARAAILGREADDQVTILRVGATLWPAASRLLATQSLPGETAAERTARSRAADLSAIGADLVPLLHRLLPAVGDLDAGELDTVTAAFSLAAAGPPDRLGVLTAILLRAVDRPAALAEPLLQAAPPGVQPRLRDIVDELLRHHRAGLEHRVAEAEAARDLPLEEAADALWQLADALVGPADQKDPQESTDSATTALRQRAAAIARERYTATIGSVASPLPAGDGAARVAAVKAREESARRLARLGQAARRLAPQTPIRALTTAAIEQLLGGAGGRGTDGPAPVGVDDARLIEILAGPEAAWQHLRPPPPRR